MHIRSKKFTFKESRITRINNIENNRMIFIYLDVKVSLKFMENIFHALCNNSNKFWCTFCGLYLLLSRLKLPPNNIIQVANYLTLQLCLFCIYHRSWMSPSGKPCFDHKKSLLSMLLRTCKTNLCITIQFLYPIKHTNISDLPYKIFRICDI